MDKDPNSALALPKRRARTNESSVSSTLAFSSPKRSSKEVRILHQPGFVLHSYPYKETSLIVDVFSREFGRLSLVAKGAKRPTSALRSVLQTFQPLNISWTGKSEVRTLTAAEWVGGMLPLEKSALLCGFYLNELLVKFLLRDEANATLFDLYVSSLNQLAHNESAAIVLRKFELILLQQAGLLGDLTYCASSRGRIQADEVYVLEPGIGVRLAGLAESVPQVSGKTLLDMSIGSYIDPQTQVQSKQLMRFLLSFHLHGAPLNTRQILIDLQKL
ncbi:DNA repair protein RecO [Undibacterium flavidum]|uniref:DNA repair protein RecO n=1 Tax=Undibacterium flavidum TaxID=2762297 RepID=A0ABR6YDG7_9BURK|nr:DNA repair protein RecO [Undibacterium flavidum]MBC3874597.1 DNA repair protein RecO [Undibacterium flavidum]